jgi:hypothetical protein
MRKTEYWRRENPKIQRRESRVREFRVGEFREKASRPNPKI